MLVKVFWQGRRRYPEFFYKKHDLSNIVKLIKKQQ